MAELDAWHALRETLSDQLSTDVRLFYRRRERRVKRKSGNIDDFCRRWGALYRYMVVLDADSVMSGQCLATLVRLMEARPDAGIIQTAPSAVGRDTLHARIQQFANQVYGPLFTAGLHYWQLGESHYWGHNAIIRLAPFMKHCVLAPLPGRGALAGEILSHDFVEAALMRRAGYGVWIAYDLPGSYEEMPSNLIEEVGRDRRWCHGNLMNARLMFAPGMHPVHRTVFLTGALAYLSAPLWAGFLALSTWLLVTHANAEPEYFVIPHQLFPLWPSWNPQDALALFAAVASMLFAPKLLAALIAGVARRAGVRRAAAARRQRHPGDLRERPAGADPDAVPHAVRAGRAGRLGDPVEIPQARGRVAPRSGRRSSATAGRRRSARSGSPSSPGRRPTSCRGSRRSRSDSCSRCRCRC